jgi:hypothetical protein
MSRRMAGVVMAYGIFLAIMSAALWRAEPALSSAVLSTMFGSGVLCVVLGILGWAGYRRRVWTLLVLIATLVLTIGQAVPSWDRGSGILEPSVLTLVLVVTVGMLMYLLHGERPPDFYSPGTKRGPDQNSPKAGSRLDS